MKVNRFTHIAALVALILSLAVSLLPRDGGQTLAATAGTISVNAASQVGTVKPYLYSNNLTPYLGAGMPRDTNYINKAIPQRYGNIRVPGGSESDGYQWWTAKAYYTDSNGRVSPHTDDFAKFAESVGAQLQIVVNYGSGTPLEAANWVEYCNSPVPANPSPGWTTSSYAGNQAAPRGYFAWLRAQRGHPQPYNVKYWEIGNEIYGSWEWDRYTNHSPTGYAQRYLQFYDAMKNVDPTIKIGVIMDGYDWWSNWNEPVMRTISTYGRDKVDFLIVHWYAWWDHSHAQSIGEAQNFLNGVSYLKDFGARMRNYINTYVSAGKAPSVELALTEWGPNSNWPDSWEAYNIWSGLWTTLMLAEGQQAGWSIMNFWNFAQGDSGYSMVDPSYRINPSYAAFDLMTRFGRGGDALVSASTTNSNAKVYASRLQNGALSLLVVNKDPYNSFDATVNISGYTSNGNATVYRYDQNMVGTNNTWRTAGAQALPIASSLSNVGNSFSYSFSPFSATVIVIGGNGQLPVPNPIPNPNPNPNPSPSPTPAPAPNIAQGKRIIVSSIDDIQRDGPNAVDGSSATRWSSAWTDWQWIDVDFGSQHHINRVVLNWEAAYASGYYVQVSDDRNNWRTIYTKTNGTGGTESLNVAGSGRYLRILCTARATQWGISLWEIQAFGYAASPYPARSWLPSAYRVGPTR